jgi:hypothetical protein
MAPFVVKRSSTIPVGFTYNSALTGAASFWTQPLEVSGQLSVVNGGTGADNATAARTALEAAAAIHGHAIADVTNLQTTLNGKAPTSHSHAISDITALQAALDAKAPSTHLHAIADVTNLQTTLNGKAATVHAHAISDITGLQAALDSKEPLARTLNNQTGTSYTLVLSDASSIVTMGSASANAITIPPNSSVAFPLGSKIPVLTLGAGQTTILQGSGVTLNPPTKHKLTGQFSAASLIKTATNTWLLEGDIALTNPGGDTTPPSITSSNSASVAENAQLAHALTANETVTWSIVGGADQARFELSGSTLRWIGNGTKNFEAPDDADTNNTYVVTVRATDAANNTVDQTITVTVTSVNEAPTVVNPLVDQSATQGQAFSYQFANNTFTDADAGTTLNYTASLSPSGALPSWLSFNAATRTFSGTPDNDTDLTVRVTASDGSLTAFDDFAITVTAIGGIAAPTVMWIAGPSLQIDYPEEATSLNLQISTDNTFATTAYDEDIAVSSLVLTVSGVLAGLPSGAYYARVSATDGGQTSAWSATAGPQTIVNAGTWVENYFGSAVIADWTADDVVQSGGTISRLTDQSGNGLHADAVNEPAYSATGFNGLPCAVLDNTGSDHLLTAVISPPITVSKLFVFVVGEFDSTGPAWEGFVTCYDSAQANDYNTINAVGICRYLSTDTWVGLRNGVYAFGAANVPTIMGMIFDGTSVIGSHDGTQSTVGESSGAFNIDRIVIGARWEGSAHSSFLKGKIRRVVLIDATSVAAGDDEKLEGYLAHDSDLEGLLPAAHPHKASPP